jgi:phosphatidylglycerophosphate synthase
MLANWITLSRFPLLLVCLVALYRGSPAIRIAAAGLLFVGLMLDTVDGVVARRTGRTSLLGSVLDIAADRTYELALWVCFADLGMIPLAIPLIVLVRTTLTDALRSVGVGRGSAPLDQGRTMLARFLVGSSPMRIAYSAAKVTTFCGLALVWAFSDLPAGTAPHRLAPEMLTTFRVTAWIAVVICVARGAPVMVGAVQRLRPGATTAPGVGTLG